MCIRDRYPVPVPDGVEVTIDGLTVDVTGPRGALTQTMPAGATLTFDDDGSVVVTPDGETRMHRSRHGLVRSLIANMVEGVTDGFTKSLELHGVGYRAQAR